MQYTVWGTWQCTVWGTWQHGTIDTTNAVVHGISVPTNVSIPSPANVLLSTAAHFNQALACEFGLCVRR